jgi:CRISPR/Cas system-associated exonuclease Cas4 (RecB family)
MTQTTLPFDAVEAALERLVATDRSSWAGLRRISKSQIQTFLICPGKFRYEYVLGAEWEFTPEALPFGSVIHATVATFYHDVQETGAKPELESWLAEFRERWQMAIADAKPPIRFQKDHTAESLEEQGITLLRAFHEAAAPRVIAEVEYPFAVPLVDPDTGETLETTLVGVMDLVETDDAGNVIAAELKTAAQRMGDARSENMLDGLVYAYALDRLGLRTTQKQTLVRYDVLVKTKTPSFQQLYVNKHEGDFRFLVRWIRRILAAIDAESFVPQAGSWACATCQFQARCRQELSA